MQVVIEIPVYNLSRDILAEITTIFDLHIHKIKVHNRLVNLNTMFFRTNICFFSGYNIGFVAVKVYHQIINYRLGDRFQ